MNTQRFSKNSVLRDEILSFSQKPEVNSSWNKLPEDLEIHISQVKSLVSRFLQYKWPTEKPANNDSLDSFLDSLWDMVDGDILSDIKNDEKEFEEFEEITSWIKTLFENEEVKNAYYWYRTSFLSKYKKLKKLSKFYSLWKIISNKNGKKEEIPLSQIQQNALVRQIIRFLEYFKSEIENQIQNIHNQVAWEKRDYLDTDKNAIEYVTKKLKMVNDEISKLVASNYEVAIQLRTDEILEDSRILKRQNVSNTKTGKKWWLWYLETKSRMDIIYWNETSNNYILSCLRWWSNVELFWPTGTGKTKLAIHAAKAFSGRNPVIVPGWLWVNKTTFYWSAKDLWKRNPWALIQCLEEDRVLIIDEDNAIDPRQMKEIKFILWLKSGDTFIHPDTGDKMMVPPHFRVVVTRNEKWKHHTDRFDLPVEYRREFTHGSFEIDYYTESETYDRFLLPKLVNTDGSIDLSVEEIWWDINDLSNTSPLLALVKSAKQIQDEFKAHKLTNSVFESGYMIDVLDQFKEVRFKVKSDGSKISFLEYLEQKLMEFIKRPIWNKDRKIIFIKLYEQWFFRWCSYEVLKTPWEWYIFSQDEYNTLTSWEKTPTWNALFKTPSWISLSSREVALLDPFYVREIKEPVHPLAQEIDLFTRSYKEVCVDVWVRPVSYSHFTFDESKTAIVGSLKKVVDEKNLQNSAAIHAIMETYISLDTKSFIEKIGELIEKFLLHWNNDWVNSGWWSSAVHDIKQTTSDAVSNIIENISERNLEKNPVVEKKLIQTNSPIEKLKNSIWKPQEHPRAKALLEWIWQGTENVDWYVNNVWNGSFDLITDSDWEHLLKIQWNNWRLEDEKMSEDLERWIWNSDWNTYFDFSAQQKLFWDNVPKTDDWEQLVAFLPWDNINKSIFLTQVLWLKFAGCCRRLGGKTRYTSPGAYYGCGNSMNFMYPYCFFFWDGEITVKDAPSNPALSFRCFKK